MEAVRFNRFGGPDALEIADLPDPRPGPGQVRIAVRAAGVTPRDWKKRQGLMDEGLPQTLGHEAETAFLVSKSSSCMVPQNDSIIALS